jgi:predicted nucleic acid-binding protein
LDKAILNAAEHKKSVEFFQDYMTIIQPPPNGETSLIKRAEEIRNGYGCSRTSDGLYLALAEELTAIRPTEFLTFDAGVINQAAKNAPTVSINLLPI